MMRSSASLVLALVAPLAFSSGCAKPPAPASSPDTFESTSPPPGWRDPSVGKQTSSPGMVATGVVLISLGATMLPIGSIISGDASERCDFDSSGRNLICAPPGERYSGIGVLAAGAGAIAVGIPLVVLGAQKVPVEIPRRSALTVGPTGASFRYDF